MAGGRLLARAELGLYRPGDFRARKQSEFLARTTGCMSAWKRKSPSPAISSAASSARARSSPCAARDGDVNVLVNRCAHRSMQFCVANRGSAKEFICPYHQWTYDLAGNLLGVPFRRGYRGQGGMPADFRPEEHGLQRLAVTHRHGVVFASFGAPNESLETYLGRAHAGLFRPRVRRARTGGARLYAPAHSEQLEADVREHQGPVSRQPAARVPGDVRTVPAGPAIRGRNGRHRPARRAGQPPGGAGNQRRDRADARVQGRISPCAIRACSIRCASSPATPRWSCRRCGPT